MQTPKYDRIIPLVGLVLLGLGVAFVLESQQDGRLSAQLWGDLPELQVSWVLVAALVIIVSTGADLLIRLHPQMQHRVLPMLRLGRFEFELAPQYWLLPSLTVVACFSFFRLLRGAGPIVSLLLGLIVCGGLLTAVLVGQFFSLDRRQEVRERWTLVLQAITYLSAFGLFTAVYANRFRTLYSAPLILIAAGLLAYELLTQAGAHRRLLALTVGVGLAQLLWPLNYWSGSFLMGGTLLLAVFYMLIGLLQAASAGKLTRQIALEFGGLGAIVLLILAGALLVGAGG